MSAKKAWPPRCRPSPTGKHCYHYRSPSNSSLWSETATCCWCGRNERDDHGPHAPGISMTMSYPPATAPITTWYEIPSGSSTVSPRPEGQR